MTEMVTRDRAVLTDDGTVIRLAVYAGEAQVSVALDPLRALALAGELIAAASRHLI
jgi:hypothetical protein